MKKEIKKKAAPEFWNEYKVYSKALDLFLAYRSLRGTGNVNMDISIFCDVLQNRLLSVFGTQEGEEDSGRT